MKTLLKKFDDEASLIQLIDAYFTNVGIQNKNDPKAKRLKSTGDDTGGTKPGSSGKKIDSSERDPPTITGLALFLGFNSLEEFDRYELKGKFAAHIKRGRLQIVAAYEKRLHTTYSSGAIFALKGMGWNQEKADEKTDSNTSATLKIIITESGPKPVSTEKQVSLENEKPKEIAT